MSKGDTFDAFLAAYNIDHRQLGEMAEAFLWYHLQATGGRDADLQTIRQYFERAGVAPPDLERLRQLLDAPDSSARGLDGRYSFKPSRQGWYLGKFEEPVFKQGLEVFVITPGVSATSPPSPPSAQPSVANPASGQRLLHWAKESPWAAWTWGLLAVVGVVLGVVALL